MFVLAQFGITLISHAWMQIIFVLYVLSPTVASYVTLKKNGEVTGIKEWLRNIFNIKNNVIYYLYVVFGVALFYSVRIMLSGLTEMLPFYMFFLMLPITLFGGGGVEPLSQQP